MPYSELNTRKWKVVINEPMDTTGKTHQLLENAGCKVILGRSISEAGNGYTEDELIELCRDADAVIGASRERYTRRFMENCSRLKVISKYGIGIEKIDIEAATSLGIVVAHTPVSENYDAVAEYTIALMLACLKRLIPGQSHVRRGLWRDDTIENSLLRGKTIGLVGLGRIGSGVAARLASWRVKLLAYDPFISPDIFRSLGVEEVSFDELLTRSDVVSIHVTITPSAKRLFSSETFSQMKRNAILVNTARAEAIDEEALIQALKAGGIAGAALDVTEQEPPLPKNPLLIMDNVIVTPHTSGWAPETREAIIYAATENCLRALRGEDPLYIKNPDVLERWRQRFKEKIE